MNNYSRLSSAAVVNGDLKVKVSEPFTIFEDLRP